MLFGHVACGVWIWFAGHDYGVQAIGKRILVGTFEWAAGYILKNTDACMLTFNSYGLFDGVRNVIQQRVNKEKLDNPRAMQCAKEGV